MAENEIRQKITLEGIDAIIGQLKQLGQSGEQAFRQLKNTVNEQPFARLSQSLNDASAKHRAFAGAAVEAAGGAHKFREAIHVLHPLLHAAGVEMGGLGSFARLAGAGVGVLGATIGGAVVLALAKLGDGALIAKKRLDDLQVGTRGGAGVGGSAFTAISKAAAELRTEVGNLTPAMEALIANARKAAGLRFTPGSAAEVAQAEKFATAVKAVFAALEGGGASAEKAREATNTFFAKLVEAGKLTPEVFEALKTAAPAAANALVEALGRGGKSLEDFGNELQSGSINIGVRQVIEAIARIAPHVVESAEHQKESIRTVGGALEQLANDWQRAFSDTGARGLVLGVLDVVRVLGLALSAVANALRAVGGASLNVPTVAPETAGGYTYEGPQFASGGSVIGAGSGTSDSILARVSNGEYVINASSTRAVGTGFLDAINSIGRYASGGSVREALGISDFVRSITPSLPGFAAGGAAASSGSRGHFTIDLNMGGNSFRMQASESVARQLNRYAVDQRLTRTGRMPNWRT